jgi:hypothetical protein
VNLYGVGQLDRSWVNGHRDPLYRDPVAASTEGSCGAVADPGSVDVLDLMEAFGVATDERSDLPWSTAAPTYLPLTQESAEAPNQPQPCDLAHVVLQVHQEIGEPSGVVPSVEPTDQRGAVDVGPLEDPEQLAGA